MKSIKPAFLSLLMISFASCSFGQVWKQYADSARFFREQKKTDKATEFYNKAREELKKVSISTNVYATICDNLAGLYCDMGQYEKAEPLYLEARQIRKEVLGMEDNNYATSCDNLAILYKDMGQYKKAELISLESKKIREKLLGKEHPDYATSCDNLATLYRKMEQFKKAEPLHLEAIKIREKVLGKEHPDYAASCINLANLYWNMGQYEKAEPLYLEARIIREKVLGKEHTDYATSCNNLANLYSDVGQYKKAEPLYLEAMEIREKVFGKGHPDYALSCIGLANLYYYMGKYEKAEPLYLEAKEIWEKVLGKEHPDYVAFCYNLAIFHKHMGQYEKAEPLYLEAKRIWEKVFGKGHPDYALSCDGLADLYQDQGQYEKAESLYLEAKQIREKVLGKEHPEYAGSCNNLANLYKDIGQYEKAESLHLEAKQIKEKVLRKEHPDYAASCHNLAILYKHMGQYEKAEPLCLEAKRIWEKVFGKGHPDYALSCNGLADLYQDKGQYEKAESLHLEAKQIREKVFGKEHPDYAGSCNNLANLYKDMGQYEKAESLHLEAKQILENAVGKEHIDYAQSCVHLAHLYWAMQQTLRAENEFEESFTISAYNLFSVFRFTNEKEKSAFIKNRLGEDDIAYSFYVSEKIKSGHPYSLSLFHRNLILSSSQALKKQLFSSNDSTLKNKYLEWIDSKKYLSVLYAKPVNERKEDIIKIEDKADQLEKELARLSSGFKKQQQRVDCRDIKDKLQADEASIEFASFHFTPARLVGNKRTDDSVLYVANVLRKDSLLPATILLFNERELNRLLYSPATKKIDGPNKLYTPVDVSKNNNLPNKSIYDLVWKPLEKELKGIKTVYFAPSGLLHKIAFAALPVNNKEVLSDKFKLVQLATTASVTDQQPSFVAASDKIQLYGDISYHADTTALKDVAFSYRHEKGINRSLPDDLVRSGGWRALPGTKKEIEDIVMLSGEYKTNITSISGVNATEESFKSLDGTASPGILHIATHGFFFPDPKQETNYHFRTTFESGKVFKLSDDPLMRSVLLFAGANHAWQNKPVVGIDDGILTAYEVSNLYLPNTKLVVLSACETGLGDIQGSEGVYGLQRAFKMAGAENLVMSLWKVPDLETAEFMHQFYKNLFAKQTINEAFYGAQKVMKDKYRAEPFKWAAWVLVR